MSKAPHTPVLAIDGGGTRCRVAACDGDTIVSVETGSANVSTDFDGAVRQITHGLEALAARLSCTVETLAERPAFVGLAGVTGPALAQRLREALPFTQVRIEDDRPAAVRGALGLRDGVIAHCGTGSFYASQIGGDIRLVGGWGPVLGDEASAQWVGRTVLGATLEVVDGLLPSSPLADFLLAEHGGAPGIVAFAGAARPTDFGVLAPLVTGHASSGDSLALHVMRAGAAHIIRALPLIGWTPGLPICLTGGIGPHYRMHLAPGMQAEIVPAQAEPLTGALSLAREGHHQ